MVALRLVSRMKRDWIHTGRRPSGLCGAALLVAARWHGFSRTLKDLIRIVKVCEATLRKRLTEFEETPSCQLTMDEFQRIDLEEEQDPPSFIQGKRKAKLLQLEEDQNGDITQEISQMQLEIEKALETPLKRKKKLDKSFELSIDGDDLAAKDFDESLFMDDCTGTTLSLTNGEKHETNNCVDTSPGQTLCGKNTESSQKEIVAKSIPSLPRLLADILDERDDNIRKLEENEINEIINTCSDKPLWENCDKELNEIGPRPTAATLGLKQSIEECLKVNSKDEELHDDGELDLDGINDDEIDRLYLLNPIEVKIKTGVWMALNSDYLREQKEKEEREAKLKEEGNQKPEKKKRKTRKKLNIQANTAGEAIEKMLAEKKISSKINYDVLKDLNRLSDVKPVAAVIEDSTVTPQPPPTPTKLSFERRFKRTSSISLDSKADIPFLPQPKHPCLESKPVVNDVVVESGPVIQNHDDHETECEEDYYEDEEEHHVSAAQLMGHTEDEVYEEDDFY